VHATDAEYLGRELFVTGDASELYMLLWKRRDAAGSEMDGSPDLLDLWRVTVRIRWSR
jgi:hypothetical protein